MHRSLLIVWASLALAGLACARAELPITPANPQASPAALSAATATTVPETSSPPATPASTAAAGGYPANGGEASPKAPLPTAAAGGYPAAATAGPTAPPTETSVIQPPPTDTPAPTATPAPTQTPTVTPPPTNTAPATNTPIRVVTATSAAAKATPSATPAGATPAPATAAPTTAANFTPGAGPAALPINAQFTQDFTVSNVGGTVIGRPIDLRDGRPDTWASLRGGSAAWVFTLNAPATIVGVRLYAQRDGADPTTLTKIEVSGDGNTWTTVYQGRGDCGAPNCDTLAQRETTDIGFASQRGQSVRITSGPTRFAFGEVQIVTAP